jgi:NADH oxidase (H2O2-forming)
MVKKVAIIGGGAAGIDVLELLLRGRRDSEKIKISLYKKEREGFFSMCGLPFALQGIYSMKALNLFDPSFYIAKGIDFRISTEVTNINLEDMHIHLNSGEEISYDYLVLAIGSKPLIPTILGTKLERVYTLGSKEDGELIERAINAKETRNVLIIGGGWIGLQTAVAVSDKGIKTLVVEKYPYILPTVLDADMASIVQKYIGDDINFILGRSADAIKGEQYVESVTIGGKDYPADLVLISAGMSPNVDIAEKAGIKIGKSGGIVTDWTLRVRKGDSFLDNVYAVGDCVEVIDAVTYHPRLSQLASTSLIQARVVTNNILGIKSTYKPCLSPTVANIAGLQVGSVGVTTETAIRYGVQIKVGKAIKYTKAKYFPGKKTIMAKLIFEAYTEKLIGAQIVSEETVAERINELTLGIRLGITAKDIEMRERCFDPSHTIVEDVIVDAAMKAFGS